MKRSTRSHAWVVWSLTLSLCTAVAGLAVLPVLAQPVQSKAYAPERLAELTSTEQRRVITQEYSDQSGGRRIPEEQMRFYLDQIRLSDWTFSRIRRDLADSLGGNGWGGQPQDQNNIRCESADNRSRTCQTPWQGASRLARQLSGTPCVEGRNWWSSNGEVQVTGGCRGEFAAIGWDGGHSGEIRCESADNRSRTCQTPWQGPSRLARQLSGTPCVEGQNWWSSYGEVQVTGGCRGAFAAAQTDPAQGREIRCESADNRTRTCATPWPGASDLSHQLSSTPCIAGQNWSSSRGEVRVWGGCRAVFVQARSGNGQGPEIRCESTDGRYRECGSGIYGRAVLVRQLSGASCTEGVTWGTRNGAIWVNGGCRGVFQAMTGGGWDSNDSVTCASENGRYTVCAWDRNRGLPRLQETLSQSRCTEGYSWGYSHRTGLWVNYGCRARFGTR